MSVPLTFKLGALGLDFGRVICAIAGEPINSNNMSWYILFIYILKNVAKLI